jgi:hypothetical protein
MTCKCAICGYERGITDDFTKWPDIPSLQVVLYPVTKGGKPDSEVLNFICARCLKNANTMRVYVKTLMSGVMVSDHAVLRYIERTGADIHDKSIGRVAVLRAFSKARKIRLRDDIMKIRIMNNDYNEMDYYWVSDTIFVVSKSQPRTIVTVEKLWKKSLNKEFFYADEPDMDNT